MTDLPEATARDVSSVPGGWDVEELLHFAYNGPPMSFICTGATLADGSGHYTDWN